MDLDAHAQTRNHWVTLGYELVARQKPLSRETLSSGHCSLGTLGCLE